MITTDITVERSPDTSGLTQQRWTFTALREGEIRLTRYAFLTRTTRRHKFNVMFRYDVYDRRHNSLPLDAVPWDENLEQEVRAVLIERAHATKVIKNFHKEARVQ